jgi:UDP-glucose 4-epimerase
MNLKNKRIAVTGGAGFIGSHVVDQLMAADNEVIVIDDFSVGKRENLQQHEGSPHLHIHEADIRDADAMMQLLKGIDYVIHMAVACLRVSIQNPVHVHDVNASGTLYMCKAALENKVQRFIYISSSESYGSAAYVPMDEGHPLIPMTVYGASKAAGELYTMAYWRTYGLPAMVVRPFNSYGPREHSEGASAEVIPKFVMRAMAGLQPIIFGDGGQTRDFTWVKDTARGIILAAECDELVGDCINIARGQEVSIREICNIVLDKLGKKDIQPRYIESGRPGDVDRHYADISKAQRLLGFTPSVDIKDGLEQYIQWVQQQNPDLDNWVAQEKVFNW